MTPPVLAYSAPLLLSSLFLKMARFTLSIFAVLAALQTIVQAATDPCAVAPIASLKNYAPAKQWCAAHSVPSTPGVACAQGDVLCMLFAGLSADAVSTLWYASLEGPDDHIARKWLMM